jgi:hypothetical protein
MNRAYPTILLDLRMALRRRRENVGGASETVCAARRGGYLMLGRGGGKKGTRCQRGAPLQRRVT